MSHEDLTDLLREWPEVPASMQTRIVAAVDGRPLLQRRVEMGVVQMEVTGRPDGARPYGQESFLDVLRTRGPGTDLTEADCAEALGEARLYLHRALALASLGHIDAAGRDAAHARAVLTDGAGSRHEADARIASSLRAQAIVLWVRAEVARSLRDHGSSRAIEAIDQGLIELGACLSADPSGASSVHGAPEHLRALRASLVLKLPSSQREELRRRLDAAIRSENFELAAILRDELRLMGP